MPNIARNPGRPVGRRAKPATLLVRTERASRVNTLIETIGDVGRRFFWDRRGRRARMEVDRNGRVWFVDDFTEKRIYTHNERGRWQGFSHGGTLRHLVIWFRKFITGEAEWIPAGLFGPWPQTLCEGDLWGYGKDMQRVRDCAFELGLIKRLSVERTGSGEP